MPLALIDTLHLNVPERVALGSAGAALVFYFFKSIIRVGILNERFQDPLAFWVGRVTFRLFRFRIVAIPGGRARRNEIMTWYFPCALIGVILTWFLLVMSGFAFLNVAFRAEANFPTSFVASGSALSTLGFSTPGTVPGEILAIAEGSIGLFLIVYLFTFLPGFMDLVHERGDRVSWIYARTGPVPGGVDLLVWLHRNGRGDSLDAVWEDWESFLRTISKARSFLSIMCVIRPITPDQSWICSVGAFLDALALAKTTLGRTSGSSRICFDCAVAAVQNMHASMRGTPISPVRSIEMHMKHEDYDAAWEVLAAAGIPLQPDRELAWKNFTQARMCYEQQIAWFVAALDDPMPAWPPAAGARAQQAETGNLRLDPDRN